MKREIILLLFIALMISCSNDNEENESGKTVTVKLANSYSNAQSDGGEVVPSEENLTSLAFYLCDDGVVKRIFNDLDPALTTIEINSADLTASSMMYVVANGEVIEELDEIVIGSTEEKLKELKTAQSDANGRVTSLAMAGYVPIVIGDKSLIIKLKRNMSRFDLENESGIEVHSIQIDELSTENRVFDFESEPIPTELTASVLREFATPLTTSLQRLFYCHPSPAGRVITINASSNGVTKAISLEMAAIKRNCIHKIRLSVSNGSLTASISISDIGSGDDVNADRITVIDAERSLISEGVVVSNAGQRVTFPSRGGEVKLFFRGNAGKVLKNGDAKHSISDFEMKADATESSYTIKIGAQTLHGGDNQVALLSFGLPEETDPLKWNHIAVVAMNYAPFSVVTFGNIDWMVSNGFSRNPVDYPTLRADYDIRDLCYLATDWGKYSGKGHQWGPRTGTVSMAVWEYSKYDHTQSPNINGSILENATSWTGTTVPCPSGWRVPTYEEFQMIWPPHGTQITENGVNYQTPIGDFSAKIEIFGGTHLDSSTSTTNVLRPAQNLIISKDNKELCFPIAGNRVANGALNREWKGYGWGMGSEVQYWCRDKVGSKFVTVGIYNGVINNNTNGVPHNDWINVRCVREVI